MGCTTYELLYYKDAACHIYLVVSKDSVLQYKQAMSPALAKVYVLDKDSCHNLHQHSSVRLRLGDGCCEYARYLGTGANKKKLAAVRSDVVLSRLVPAYTSDED